MLDFFSRVHPLVPLLVFIPVIVGMAVWGLSQVSVAAMIGLAVGGYALWTLFEYWLHRIVFHFEPQAGVAHGCTGSSTASTTSTPTTRCAW